MCCLSDFSFLTVGWFCLACLSLSDKSHLLWKAVVCLLSTSHFVGDTFRGISPLMWSRAPVCASRVSGGAFVWLTKQYFHIATVVSIKCAEDAAFQFHFISFPTGFFFNIGGSDILFFLKGTISKFSPLVSAAQHANEEERLPLQSSTQSNKHSLGQQGKCQMATRVHSAAFVWTFSWTSWTWQR